MHKAALTVGGAAWLNLLNTRYRSQDRMVDLLQEETVVREWLIQNGLLRPEEWDRIEPEKHKLIEELTRLRDMCQTMLHTCKHTQEVSLSAVAPLQDWLNRFALHVRLRVEDGILQTSYDAADPIDHLLVQIGLSAVDTLRTLPLERIRECEHADCVLFFADTSKSGKRRWCSMETCGNRHKAAEFYARQKRKQAK